MLSDIKKFASWGVLAYVFFTNAYVVLILAVLIQKKFISNFFFFGIKFDKYVLLLLGISFFLAYLFGWIAIYFGRRLHCSQCGGETLRPDRFGFRGLQLRPVLSAARGNSICPICQSK